MTLRFPHWSGVRNVTALIMRDSPCLEAVVRHLCPSQERTISIVYRSRIDTYRLRSVIKAGHTTHSVTSAVHVIRSKSWQNRHGNAERCNRKKSLESFHINTLAARLTTLFLTQTLAHLVRETASFVLAVAAGTSFDFRFCRCTRFLLPRESRFVMRSSRTYRRRLFPAWLHPGSDTPHAKTPTYELF